LDDLLDSWKKENTALTFEGIRVVGTKWSHSCHKIKDFLSKNQISYLWQDIDIKSDLKISLKRINPDLKQPVIYFPDGEYLISPSIQVLAERLGLQTKASQPFYDLIIIGAGPAGLAAGVYGASEGLKTLIIDKESTGGQAGTSSKIENYLGFPKGISGNELAQKATMQAKRLGAEILLPHEVMKVKIKDPTAILKVVELKDGTELACFALIIATGVSVNKFQLPGIEKFIGAGVFYGAALTETQNYKGKEVIVLGGGNSAGQGAMFFSHYASKVKIVIRRDSLVETMSQYLIEQLESTENIELVPNTLITEVKGKDTLESVITENTETNEKTEIEASALFIFIGARPFTDMVDDLVLRDENGYILTGFDLGPVEKLKTWNLERDPMIFETNIPGIFACGDVRYGSSKRVAAAVGEGSVAVRLVHEYLKTI
jgi:thioredoxin reductase (NADPH)